MDSLLENANRRFTYVEMAFFSMWWEQQTEKTRYQVQQLVEQKQLDFTMYFSCYFNLRVITTVAVGACQMKLLQATLI